jgi:hypothetical protein
MLYYFLLRMRRCGVCGKSVLYSYDHIGFHANKKHGLTLADYRAGYLPSGPNTTSTSDVQKTAGAITNNTEKSVAAKVKVAPISARAEMPQNLVNAGTEKATTVQTSAKAAAELRKMAQPSAKAVAEVTSEGEEPEEMCLARCRVCKEEFAHHLIRGHLAERHSITEKYWEQYLFSRKTFHRYGTVPITYHFSYKKFNYLGNFELFG